MVPTHQPSLSPTLAPTTPTITPSQSPSTHTPTLTPSTMLPTKRPTTIPTKTPTKQPTGGPTCNDRIDYCGLLSSFCNSTEAATQMKMSQDCSSTCGLCSSTPTEAPSESCVDRYKFCEHGALNGGCRVQHYETRSRFISDCPYSCETCHGATLTPTYHPTSLPTISPTTPPTDKPSLRPSEVPTAHPTKRPTSAPTCNDLLLYCWVIKANCSSSDQFVQSEMRSNCALTCGFCTSRPTISPSEPCVDSYSYCSELAIEGACFNGDYETRVHFRNDCPVSCSTCHGNTVAPSEQPSISPTGTPTCRDMIGYCNLLLPYCNSSFLQAKVQRDCAQTCGFCTDQPELPQNCSDKYSYCEDVARAGACSNDDNDARLHFLKDCPVSCNTC